MDLAAGFASISRDDWRALAMAVLRKSGVDAETPEEALSHSTYDGVAVAPLYDAADLPASAPFERGSRPAGGWDVRQRHALPDSEAVMADLENGVTSLWLVVGDDAIPAGDLPRVLKGVHLDLAPVVLEAGEQTAEAAEALFELAGDKPLLGNLGASPLSADAAALASRCAAGHPGLRAVMVDATPYHDAGGSDAEELGCSLALAVAGLRALTAAGLTVQQACDQLEFRYAASDDQFATIAKLRAARRLWDRVLEVTGASGQQRQHAVTSSAMMTARDPWVNMLRTTVACFAAGVGGADAVTVQPFDAVVRRPDAFSRRIARNTQSLLLEESGVGRVIDPAGGSWYVERHTEDLAERAWAWFQEIEAAGGIQAAAGLVAERIAATRERRADDLAHRRLPVTGVSEFPDLEEKPLTGASADGPFLASHSPAALAAGLPKIRYAQEFEELRDLADAQAERPKVFLATIGPVAVHTPRATFAANLFRAGGLATETAGPGTDPEQIATAFAVSGAAVACLCSGDKLYEQHAEAVAAALRKAGARTIWLAGKGDYKGVDGYLYTGCDALGVLRKTFRDLEVTG